MLAVDVNLVKNLALGGIGLSLLLAVISALVLKSIISKAISLVLLLAIAIALYTQRDQLQTCADQVQKGSVTPGKTTTCTFFGAEIKIKIPSSID